jgi:hypothetical protein
MLILYIVHKYLSYSNIDEAGDNCVKSHNAPILISPPPFYGNTCYDGFAAPRVLGIAHTPHKGRNVL